MNLYGIKSNYGAHYIIGSHYARALFLESDEYDEVLGIVSIIHELGYLIKEKEHEYRLSAKGWQRVCCRKDSFSDESEVRPHFDISQKSMVVWETQDELVEKLEKRIKATVY